MKLNLTVPIEELYKVLCEDCRKRLLDLMAQQNTAEALKDQLKKHLEKGD